MEDGQRKSLVTQFVCAECGEYLSLSYKTPGKPGNSLDGEDYSITGANKVHMNIAVHRCDGCYRKSTELLKTLQTLLKEKL